MFFFSLHFILTKNFLNHFFPTLFWLLSARGRPELSERREIRSSLKIYVFPTPRRMIGAWFELSMANLLLHASWGIFKCFAMNINPRDTSCVCANLKCYHARPNDRPTSTHKRKRKLRLYMLTTSMFSKSHNTHIHTHLWTITIVALFSEFFFSLLHIFIIIHQELSIFLLIFFSVFHQVFLHVCSLVSFVLFCGGTFPRSRKDYLSRLRRIAAARVAHQQANIIFISYILPRRAWKIFFLFFFLHKAKHERSIWWWCPWNFIFSIKSF